MSRHGRIELITGPMFAGKSTALIGRLTDAREDGLHVMAINHASDTRYSGPSVISSHGGAIWSSPTYTAKATAQLQDLNVSIVDVLGIDEVQWFDKSLVRIVEGWALQGRRVICAGLDRDHRGRTYTTTGALLGAASCISKLQSRCATCEAPATYTKRIDAHDAPVLIGGAEMYEPRCIAHWETP